LLQVDAGLSGTVPVRLFQTSPRLYGLSLYSPAAGIRAGLSGTLPFDDPQVDLSSAVALLLWTIGSGTIPQVFTQSSRLPRLQRLEIGGSGTIPAQVGNLKQLNLLAVNLGSELLSGTIPSTLGLLTNLSRLGLGTHGPVMGRLSGTLPPQLSRLTRLDICPIGFNSVSGTLPT
jgi:hypothetical protein